MDSLGSPSGTYIGIIAYMCSFHDLTPLGRIGRPHQSRPQPRAAVFQPRGGLVPAPSAATLLELSYTGRGRIECVQFPVYQNPTCGKSNIPKPCRPICLVLLVTLAPGRWLERRPRRMRRFGRPLTRAHRSPRVERHWWVVCAVYASPLLSARRRYKAAGTRSSRAGGGSTTASTRGREGLPCEVARKTRVVVRARSRPWAGGGAGIWCRPAERASSTKAHTARGTSSRCRPPAWTTREACAGDATASQ